MVPGQPHQLPRLANDHALARRRPGDRYPPAPPELQQALIALKAHWAKVIGELLHTPRELRRLGAHARAHAERFSWDMTTDALLAAYREVSI